MKKYKILVVTLTMIIAYLIFEYLLVNYGNINIPSYLKFIVVVLCVIIASYNAFKQNKK